VAEILRDVSRQTCTICIEFHNTDITRGASNMRILEDASTNSCKRKESRVARRAALISAALIYSAILSIEVQFVGTLFPGVTQLQEPIDSLSIEISRVSVTSSRNS